MYNPEHSLDNYLSRDSIQFANWNIIRQHLQYRDWSLIRASPCALFLLRIQSDNTDNTSKSHVQNQELQAQYLEKIALNPGSHPSLLASPPDSPTHTHERTLRGAQSPASSPGIKTHGSERGAAAAAARGRRAIKLSRIERSPRGKSSRGYNRYTRGRRGAGGGGEIWEYGVSIRKLLLKTLLMEMPGRAQLPPGALSVFAPGSIIIFSLSCEGSRVRCCVELAGVSLLLHWFVCRAGVYDGSSCGVWNGGGLCDGGHLDYIFTWLFLNGEIAIMEYWFWMDFIIKMGR